jgi:Na+/H+ antiporter NhaC
MTQLPYALICAAISIVGYLIIGLTSSTLLAMAAVVILLIVIVLVSGRNQSNIKGLEEKTIQ